MNADHTAQGYIMNVLTQQKLYVQIGSFFFFFVLYIMLPISLIFLRLFFYYSVCACVHVSSMPLNFKLILLGALFCFWLFLLFWVIVFKSVLKYAILFVCFVVFVWWVVFVVIVLFWGFVGLLRWGGCGVGWGVGGGCSPIFVQYPTKQVGLE